MSTETLQREETITKPPTRWKNRWQAHSHGTGRCVVCLSDFEYFAGEVAVIHCLSYPSKDVAETHASDLDRKSRGSDFTYLGAFPVEEAP